MPRRTDMMTTWEPSPEQEYGAQLIAAGRTWAEVASELQITSRTIGNWLRRPEFRDLVRRHTERVAQALDSQIILGTEEMVGLWRQMVRGEVAADDRRIDRIERLMERYFGGAIGWDDAPAGNADAGRGGTAIQFNFGTGSE